MHRSFQAVAVGQRFVRIFFTPRRRRVQAYAKHNIRVRHLAQKDFRFVAKLRIRARLEPLRIANEKINLNAALSELFIILRIHLHIINVGHTNRRQHWRIDLPVDKDRRCAVVIFQFGFCHKFAPFSVSISLYNKRILYAIDYFVLEMYNPAVLIVYNCDFLYIKQEYFPFTFPCLYCIILVSF